MLIYVYGGWVIVGWNRLYSVWLYYWSFVGYGGSVSRVSMMRLGRGRVVVLVCRYFMIGMFSVGIREVLVVWGKFYVGVVEVMVVVEVVMFIVIILEVVMIVIRVVVFIMG